MPGYSRVVVYCLLLTFASCINADSSKHSGYSASLFAKQKFTAKDSVLVAKANGEVVYAWQPDQPLIPASLMKLVVAQLAIDKWGLEHRFVTDFYLNNSELWIEGYGDPYVTSEEIDLITAELDQRLPRRLSAVNIDNNYFAKQLVPGRSAVNDPYNAPLSAVSANFNTVNLQRVNGQLRSAEEQTPLTSVAQSLGGLAKIGAQAERVNLVNADNAQMYFAELLLAKLELDDVDINNNQTLPPSAELVYRHKNSHSLAQVLRGTLKYSNNFIANQLFLMLGELDKQQQMRFSASSTIAQQQTAEEFGWQSHVIADGSGLSRQSRLSASQINQLLRWLAPHNSLLREYPIKGNERVKVFAKSGTLNGVHNLAGYIDLIDHQYTFVLIFNQAKPYGHREALLAELVAQLADL